MHQLEAGILEGSQIYFLQPSRFAQEQLFCLQHIGVFTCDARYAATHTYWESVLCLFIDAGVMEVAVADQLFEARAGDVVVIDCRVPHSYHAWDGLRFHYFHCTGPSTAAYAKLLTEWNGGSHLQDAQTTGLHTAFQSLLRLAQTQVNLQDEHRISVYLHLIFCELVETCARIPPSTSACIDQAIAYMEQHVTETVSMDALAAHIHLSKFHFTRHFKKYMGVTPHRYFAGMRIQLAKRLLVTTQAPVEQIAEQCGFDNASNFIRFFKKYSGITPSAFRKIAF